MDHQVVRLSEPTLAVLAHELAFRPHLASELPPVVTLHLHNREHDAVLCLVLANTLYSLPPQPTVHRTDLKHHITAYCKRQELACRVKLRNNIFIGNYELIAKKTYNSLRQAFRTEPNLV